MCTPALAYVSKPLNDSGKKVSAFAEAHIAPYSPILRKCIRGALHKGWTLKNIDYPEAEVVALGFSQRPLALYTHSIQITTAAFSDKKISQ